MYITVLRYAMKLDHLFEQGFRFLLSRVNFFEPRGVCRVHGRNRHNDESSTITGKSEEKYSDFGLLFSDLPLKRLQLFIDYSIESHILRLYDFTLRITDNHSPILRFCLGLTEDLDKRETFGDQTPSNIV